MSNQPAIELYRLPVTALALTDAQDHLCVGQGPHFRVYDCRTSSTLYSTQLLKDQAIHGITLYNVGHSRYVVLVWGGHMLCILLLQLAKPDKMETPVTICARTVKYCSDWILHGEFEPDLQNDLPFNLRVAVVTAHNALRLLSIDLKNAYHQEMDRLELLTTQSNLSDTTRCMLYSANVNWLSSEHILITAGTPFGTLRIWSCFIIPRRLEESSCEAVVVQAHYNFMAHEDSSVFDVASIKAVGEDFDRNKTLLVASCSDDRTIKIWNVSDILLADNMLNVCDSESDETCISARRPIKIDSKGASPVSVRYPSAVVLPYSPSRSFGHLSRIWKVSFVTQGGCKTPSISLPILMSLAEDATAQLWQFDQDLRHIVTLSNHSGKNIWSAVATFFTEYCALVISGGSDSGIILTKTDLCRLQPSKEHSMKATKEHSSKSDKLVDRLKSYSFIGRNSLLATNSNGDVLVGRITSTNAHDFIQPENIHFQKKETFEDLKNYSVICGVPKFNIGFVAGTQGAVYYYDGALISSHPIVRPGGRVDGLFAQVLEHQTNQEAMSPLRSAGNVEIALLTSNSRSATANLYFFCTNIKSSNVDEIFETLPKDAGAVDLSARCVWNITIPKKEIITSFLFTNLSSMSNATLLCLGTRSGMVFTYLVEDTLPDGNNSFKSSHTVLSLSEQAVLPSVYHHQDAVTRMEWRTQEHESQGIRQGFLLSTGRDSTYAIYRYSLNEMRQEPTLVHRVTLPFGPFIEGFYSSRMSQQLNFYGFKGEDFIVLEEPNHAEKFKVRCGGAHRISCFYPPSNSDDASLVWTRASNLYTYVSSTSKSTPIQVGGHGREIKACAITSTTFGEDLNPSYLIATGAEDTDIRLSKFYVSSGLSQEPALFNCTILREHVTGLQHMQFSADGKYLFSSGGQEEFFVWRLRKTLFVPIGVVCESKLPPISENSDLRIMGFEAIAKEDITIRTPEHNGATVFIISIVLSNSSLRLYRYTSCSPQPKWQLLASSTYGTSCLTAGIYAPFSSLGVRSCGMELAVAGTDGVLSIWNFGDVAAGHESSEAPSVDLGMQFRSRIHQSTIRCLKSVRIASSTDTEEKGVCLLLGGGDDNALSFTLVRTGHSVGAHHDALDSHKSHYTVLESALVTRAHSASITGVVAWHRETKDISARQIEGRSHIRVASASNDQRLRIWDVDIDLQENSNGYIQVKRVANVFSGVADASSLELIDNEGDDRQNPLFSSEASTVRVVVCGVGIEVWQIPRKSVKIPPLQ